jgi:hypothetical protein
MIYDPNNHRRSRLNPLSHGATSPLYRHDDGSNNQRAGIIIIAVISLVAVVGLITWFGGAVPQSPDDLPGGAQTTTGQGGQFAPPTPSEK